MKSLSIPRMSAAAAAVAMLLNAVAPLAHAGLSGTLQVADGPDALAPYSYSYGGAFTVYGIDPSSLQTSIDAGYSPNALVTAPVSVGGPIETGFETFCVESGIGFSPDATYNFTTGLAIQQAALVGEGESLDLTDGAAWLYEQFATGALAADTGGAFSYTSTDDMGDLQSVIWTLLGQTDPTYGYFAPPGGTPDLLGLATAQNYGLGNNAYTAVTSGAPYGVQVLELTDSNDNIDQDQLVYIAPSRTVPDAGATIGLLGAALMGLAMLRRRLAFQA